MPYTPVFSQGVKFIKIARVDKQGKDNTLSLQELNSIRIDYSDTDIVEYPIVSIAKYDDYFLFGVATTNITSSTDNQILNYRFSGSYSGSYTDLTEFLNINNLEGNGVWVESYDNLNYFTGSTGRYTLGNLPNIPITLIASCSVTSSDDTAGITFRLLSTQQGVLATRTASLGNGANTILSASYSAVPNENEQFYLQFGSTNFLSYFTASFKVTQSIAANASSSDLVVLQPYIDENFSVSEYNVLAGNAVIPRYSELYMDVDYSTNVIQAVNSASIIDGTATRAAVQDSNYTTFANISPRYIGKELTSAKFNEWTDGDISYGKVPNVSNPEVNFVSFKSLNGTSPQWGNNNVDMTQVNIEYIIDNNNSITKPINDSEGINLNTIRQTFAEVITYPTSRLINGPGYIKSNATILLNNNEVSGSDLSTLNGSWPLYKSGYRIEPILYTQTASYDTNGNITGFGYFPTMSFVRGEQGPDDTKNNYMMYAANEEDIISLNMAVPAGLHFSPPTFIGESGSFSNSLLPVYSGSVYNPTGSLAILSDEGYFLDFHVYLAATERRGLLINYALQKSTDGGNNWTNLTTIQTDYVYTTTSSIFYREYFATTSSLYRVAVIDTGVSNAFSPGSYPTIPYVNLNNTSYFWVTQYPNPGVGTCTKFWTTGSSASILLASTASDGLNNYRNQKQKDIENSGFKPINLDFEPQAYDEIRFEGLEQLSFTIVNVTSSANNQMIINLDREIPNGVNLDYFFLRRYVDDPSSILIDVNYPLPDKSGSASITGNGILKPQYVTNEVNTIIQNTINQNLI